MRHFAFLDPVRAGELFFRLPEDIQLAADRRLVATALGATLYSPGTRPDLVSDIRKQARRGVTSMVLCLEDAIADDEVPVAEDNVVRALGALADDPGGGGEGRLPLLFVRIRSADQVPMIVRRLGRAARDVLAGFVLPKFSEERGDVWLSEVARASDGAERRLWAMPVLETPEIIYRELRIDALAAVRRLVDKHAETVLAVRIGATDLCGLFGLRRDRDLTIWDIAVVRECIADIVNVCARGGETVVTGPVWEYFDQPERLFVSPLRVTPFAQADLPAGTEQGTAMRQRLVSRDLDRLIREVVLDKANGLLGKTVIHPSHVPAVHALHAVTHEEYDDAMTVLDGQQGGVRPSSYANKMNELRPHRTWAEGVLRRARAYGVLRAGHTFVDLLADHP